MAITRRQFLKRSGTAAAGALLAPRLFGSSFVQDALAAIGNRYFVVVYLDGGNDGLNTVVPTGGVLRPWYESGARDRRGRPPSRPRRPRQYARSATIRNTGSSLALHPGLRASTTGTRRRRRPARALRGGQGRRHPGLRLSELQPVARGLAADLPDRRSESLALRGHGLGRPAPRERVRRTIDGDPGGQHPRLGRRRLPAEHDERARGPPPARLQLPVRSRLQLDVGEERAQHRVQRARTRRRRPASIPGFKYIGNAGATTLASTNAYPALHSLYNNNADPRRVRQALRQRDARRA